MITPTITCDDDGIKMKEVICDQPRTFAAAPLEMNEIIERYLKTQWVDHIFRSLATNGFKVQVAR
jgi:hypothetical protein